MLRRLPLAVVVTIAVLAATAMPAGASTVPSGERMFGRAGVEGAYNAEQGGFGYFMVPVKAPDPAKANPASWSPIYLPVYPTGSTAAETLNCMHVPVENCPSHGNLIAGLAQQMRPDVYGDGVLGHDHVLDFPGGSDFNVAWEPIAVLFTSKAAANEHLVTDAAIEAAVQRGDAIEIPLPQATFYCAAVPQRIWDKATPVV